MGNFAITIGRESGSGGLDIGKLVAVRLGIKCYDKELIQVVAENSGLCEEVLHNHDEKPTNSFLYSLVMDTYSTTGFTTTSAYMDMPLNHKVFLAQFDAIKKLVEKESCIIVGRCADYALADNEKCLNVFIQGDRDYRIKRVMDAYDMSEAKARDFVNKTDKKRSSYYNHYSGKKWGDSRSYDLCLDSEILGIEGCVEMIISCLKQLKFI